MSVADRTPEKNRTLTRGEVVAGHRRKSDSAAQLGDDIGISFEPYSDVSTSGWHYFVMIWPGDDEFLFFDHNEEPVEIAFAIPDGGPIESLLAHRAAAVRGFLSPVGSAGGGERTAMSTVDSDRLEPVRGPNAREWLRTFFDASFAPAKLAKDGGQFRKLHVKAINRFEKCLGRKARLGDLTEANLRRFAGWLESAGYGPRARDTGPSLLRSIWQFAATIKRVRKAPRDGRKTSLFEAEWGAAARQRGPAGSLRRLAVSRGMAKALRPSINRLHQFIGREPLAGDVKRELLGRFIDWLVGYGFGTNSAVLCRRNLAASPAPQTKAPSGPWQASGRPVASAGRLPRALCRRAGHRAPSRSSR